MTVRFGLVGTGYWARETDATAIAAHPDAELVGVWGRDPVKARSLAQDFGATAFEDVDELIAAVDALAFAVPPDVQAPVAIRAATAGRHLLLDKPLAFSTAEADAIVDAVRSAEVRALVFHTARFMPAAEAWLREVRAAGDWDGANVTLLASIFQPGNPFGASAWRREKGALWDVGPHALDMVISALGPVEGVLADAGRGDTVHLVLRHRSGASSALSLSLTVPEKAETSAWWVYGPRGVSQRPDGPTTPAEAFGHAIGALLAPQPAADGVPPSDVDHGREIVRVLQDAEGQLARRSARGLELSAAR